MAIIRFIDKQGLVHQGEQLTRDTAQLLAGNIEQGFSPSGETKTISRLLAPIIPLNIFAIGFNYSDHIDETGFKRPKTPVLFMKATSSLNAPNAPIVIPQCEIKGNETDYEGELAVIIGKPGKDIPADQAMNHVFGYTCANDVSARRWQKHGGAGQWVRAKSFDTFCPLGPAIMPKEQVANPQNLSIQTKLNGELMQNSNTSKMIFPINELIAFVSQDTTLLPGTVILTGTPDGVGFAQKPMRFLEDGDRVSVSIENIGTLENPVAKQK